MTFCNCKLELESHRTRKIWNQEDLAIHTHWNGHNSFKGEITSIGEPAEKVELLGIGGGNVKWASCHAEQGGGSPKR